MASIVKFPIKPGAPCPEFHQQRPYAHKYGGGHDRRRVDTREAVKPGTALVGITQAFPCEQMA